jgi:very-short-patch-repair endonuclease
MVHAFNDPDQKSRRVSLRKQSTDAERLVWSHLRNKQIIGLKFYRQFGVGPYILDFYCPSKGLGIEIDGGQHNSPEGRESDEKRSAFLKEKGVTVIRFWNNEVMGNIQGVFERILEIVTPPAPS